MILIEHVVTAQRRVERKIAERIAVAQQKVVVEFDVADRLFAVHSVEVGMRVLRFLLRTEIVAEVDARTHGQRQFLGNNMPRHAGIAVNTVFGLRIQTFVNNEIGIVHRSVNQLHRRIAARIVVDQPAAVPFVVCIAGRSAHRLPEQRFQGRRIAVSPHGQVVRIFAVVAQFQSGLDVFVPLADSRKREVLGAETRIGHDPVVARILDRHAQRRAMAVAGVHRQTVGVGNARPEESLVPVAYFVRKPRIGPRRRIERGIHVTHLPLDFLAELVTRMECIYFFAGIRMIGVDRVERIFVGIQAVGHMPRIDGRFAEVAGAVYILEIGPVTRLVEGYRGGKSNPDALLLAARLGRNDDGAVGGARSVKRRCSRAFQHRDRLHVVGIDVTGAIAVVDRGVVRFVRTRRRIGIHTAADGHTVDHEQSRIVVIRERALAAQRDTDRSAGSCGRLVEIQTGNLTGHTAQPTAAGIVGDVVGADLRDGIAEALLLTGDTEGRHHHVLDAVGRRPELEVDTRTGVHRLRHRIVTQIGTDNFAVCRNIQRIFAVGAGAHTEGRTLDDQRRTDERHAVGITHRTGYFHIGTGLVGRLAHEHDLCSPHCSRHLGDRLRDDRLDGGVGHAERDPAGSRSEMLYTKV